jgi:hypothetical protein
MQSIYIQLTWNTNFFPHTSSVSQTKMLISTFNRLLKQNILGQHNTLLQKLNEVKSAYPIEPQPNTRKNRRRNPNTNKQQLDLNSPSPID